MFSCLHVVPLSDKEEQALSVGEPKQLVKENTRISQPTTTSAHREGEDVVYGLLSQEEMRIMQQKRAREGKVDLDGMTHTT